MLKKPSVIGCGMAGTGYRDDHTHCEPPKNMRLEDVVGKVHKKIEPEIPVKPVAEVKPNPEPYTPPYSGLGFYDQAGNKLTLFQAIKHMFTYRP